MQTMLEIESYYLGASLQQNARLIVSLHSLHPTSVK